MNEQGMKKKEPYKRLAEINRAITTSLNFDKVLDPIVENAAHLVGATVSLLLLVDKTVSNEHFDVILSDISMPGMDGFELLRILQELPGVRDTPVLALTGFGRAEDVAQAKAEGFFSHVTKPIDLGQLVEILQELKVKE
jgi:two-component system CheB/CheR fusion protein